MATGWSADMGQILDFRSLRPYLFLIQLPSNLKVLMQLC